MKGKFLGLAILWVFIIGIIAVFYRYVYVPSHQKALEAKSKNEKVNTLINTSANSHYKHNINFAIDSFSGYSILRSEAFKNFCSSDSIKINLIDDGADYTKRFKSLQSGETQMGVFTVDALIKSSWEAGDIPNVIVAFVDETRGADAMVSYKNAIPNIDALDDAETKFVATANSPSETLSRVLLAHFNLKHVDKQNCWEFAQDAKDVYDRYRKSKPTEKKVFVLWEPYVSKILENPNTIILTDSGKFKGFIVDVIVVSRDFLIKNEDVVRDVVKDYFKAVYAYRNDMAKLVLNDSIQLGNPLKPDQATKLIEKIWWKNTQENFSHLGLGGKNLQHVEDMISNITDVLVKTGAITKDPTQGKPNYLYYDNILKDIYSSGFHPGNDETIRKEEKLVSLSDEQWHSLVPVGTLAVPDLVFARGTVQLTELSRQNLTELCQKLKNWPQYYLIVEGNSSNRGNMAANKELAKKRAELVTDYVVSQGIDKNRVKAFATEPKNAPTVSFVLGQPPY